MIFVIFERSNKFNLIYFPTYELQAIIQNISIIKNNIENMNDLVELLKIEGAEINHFFAKASLEGKGTPQEVSDRREAALTNFLKKYFPFPYRVTKGNILDSFGNRSASIDCILLNPTHPYTTSDDAKYSIILADGVDVAIELKPHLNSDIEIERSLKQVQTVKELTRQKGGVMKVSILNNVSDEYFATSMKIPCVIFGIETYKSIELLLEKIVTYYEENKISRSSQFDFIVINNQCLILNSKKDSYIYLKEIDEGLYVLNYGDLTISAFLMYLNKLPQSEIRISKSVLDEYLKVKPEDIKTYPNINERLKKI